MEGVVRAVLLLTLVLGMVSAAPFTDLDLQFSKPLGSERQLSLIQQLEALMAREPEVRQSAVRKRGGLGSCIHNCMHSGGGLNFIQCKTMCYW